MSRTAQVDRWGNLVQVGDVVYQLTVTTKQDGPKIRRTRVWPDIVNSILDDGRIIIQSPTGRDRVVKSNRIVLRRAWIEGNP